MTSVARLTRPTTETPLWTMRCGTQQYTHSNNYYTCIYIALPTCPAHLSITPLASPVFPRLGAMESSSSKKIIQGAAPLAREKMSRTFSSVCPTYILISSGPFTLYTVAEHTLYITHCTHCHTLHISSHIAHISHTAHIVTHCTYHHTLHTYHTLHTLSHTAHIVTHCRVAEHLSHSVLCPGPMNVPEEVDPTLSGHGLSEQGFPRAGGPIQQNPRPP